MADTGLTSFPVVERGEPGRLLGIVGLRDLLRARERQLSEERNRERWLRVRLFRGGSAPAVAGEAAD
jgi:CBS domain containing-hemolysin-like protein